MKERRLTQKTNITINVIILFTLIVSMVGVASAGTTIINDIEHQVENNTEQIVLIRDIINIVIEQQGKQDGLFIEILTDLKWIIADLENRQEK